MKKIIAMLMAVLVVFSVTACGGKKMETFGMSAQGLANSYDSEVREMIDKEPTIMLESMYTATKLENIQKVSSHELDNGKTANVYEVSRDVGEQKGVMGYKFMEESNSNEVFYAEIWVDGDLVTDTFLPFWLGLYGSLATATVEDMTQEKFAGFIDEMSAEYDSTGVFGKEYGKYYFEFLPSNDKACYIVTTKEYNDMTK